MGGRPELHRLKPVGGWSVVLNPRRGLLSADGLWT